MKDDRLPIASFVIATHNRREVVLDTLAQVHRCGLDRGDFEIILVDNASSDGTPDAADSMVDRIIRRRTNRGSCAKAFGVDAARGRFIVFLDDDSAPRPGSVARMLAHFEEQPRLGAAGFTVHLPNSELEGAALPNVFVGCGVGFRAEALRRVGGLDLSFFMQAEEYDLCFRLAFDGWCVRMFDDLHVDHRKSTTARRHNRTMFYDVRNNLRVAARYLPEPSYREYKRDWLLRYAWLAEDSGQVRAFRRGRLAGSIYALTGRRRYRKHRLPPLVFEEFFCWKLIEEKMADLRREGVKNIVLADLGKNIFPFVRAADRCGIQLLAIADDRFAKPGRRYRGLSICPSDEAMALGAEAVVVANTGPVHARRTAEYFRSRCAMPVHNWFGELKREQTEEIGSEQVASSADVMVSERVCATRG